MTIAQTVSWAARFAWTVCLAAVPGLASGQTIHHGPVVTATAVQQPGANVPSIVHLNPVSSWVDLKAAIQRGRQALNPSRLPDPKAARQRLTAEIEAFERYLGGPDSSNAKAWLKFLKWKDLLSEAAKNEPNLKTLTDVQLRFQQNTHGLEYAPFQAMRRAIADFIAAERYGSSPEGTIKVLDAQLEKLITVVDSQSESSELERSREISAVADNLIFSNQAPELLAAFRAAYSMPNVRLSVGEAFVNRAIGRPVNQPNPVNECVLGTRVLGNSIINGSVFADLVPQHNGVGLQLTLSGSFASDNIGYNRGVKVYTTGTSPVYASKRITITPEGTFTEPAVASTNLQTSINGIDHRLRIVRRIASRKAAEQKPEANAIGQYRLQSRLARQYNDQIEQQLAQGGGNLNALNALNQERVELTRLGVPKPTWSLRTDTTQILADIKEAAGSQLAAPNVLPATGSQDIVAQIHQSLPMNLAESVLGGRTLHSWEMDDFVRQYTSDVPAELIQESEGEPWSLTFAAQRPVEVEFQDGLLKATLRITRMANQDQALTQPAMVKAVYKPVLSGGYLVMERQGDVELEFVKSPTGFRAVTLRSFFKGKFDKLFREKSQPQRVTFPTRIPNVSQLAVSNVTFNKGWVQFTLQ